VRERRRRQDRDFPTGRADAVGDEADDWLQSLGFTLDEVVMAERNERDARVLSQARAEWRIKRSRDAAEMGWHPASRTRINGVALYHSAKGVHFLPYAEFHVLPGIARTDFPMFVECLRELVSIFEGDVRSCMRSPKFHGTRDRAVGCGGARRSCGWSRTSKS
jgi:hypothetical protein